MAGGLLESIQTLEARGNGPWAHSGDRETVSAFQLLPCTSAKQPVLGQLQVGDHRLAKITHMAVELGFKPSSETLLLITEPQSLSIFPLVPFKTYTCNFDDLNCPGENLLTKPRKVADALQEPN